METRARRSELAQDHTLGMKNQTQPRIGSKIYSHLLHCLQGEEDGSVREQSELGNGEGCMGSRGLQDAEGFSRA